MNENCRTKAVANYHQEKDTIQNKIDELLKLSSEPKVTEYLYLLAELNKISNSSGRIEMYFDANIYPDFYVSESAIMDHVLHEDYCYCEHDIIIRNKKRFSTTLRCLDCGVIISSVNSINKNAKILDVNYENFELFRRNYLSLLVNHTSEEAVQILSRKHKRK